MNIREHCYDIVRNIPEQQLSYIAAILENAQKMIDEMQDDAYCLELYRSAKADPDNAEGVSLEEYAAKWGIDLEAEGV